MKNTNGTNQNDIQRLNRSLVLTILKRSGVCSRAEIAKLTGLQQATISNIISEFIDWGIVKEVGLLSSRKGRRSIGIQMNTDQHYVIGTRLTRDFFEVGIFDLLGQNLLSRKIKNDKASGPRFVVEKMKNEIGKLLQNTTYKDIISSGYVLGIPIPIIYSVVLVAVFSVFLNKTRFGTYIYAVGGNQEAARLSGVPIKKVIIICYVISGFMSAFAGLVLCARMFSGQPSIGDGYELDAIAACVLGGISMSGGIGKISGTVFGAITIGMISNGLNLMNVSSYWQYVAKGIIIVIAILIDAQKNNNKMKIMMQKRADALKQK